MVFDIETNGFVAQLDRLHCLVIRDVDTGEQSSHTNVDKRYQSIESGLKRLMAADVIVGHNIIKFDIPAIKKVYPWFEFKGEVFDTLTVSRVLWPDIKQKDYKRNANGTLPGNLIGRYSLESFGWRLGEYKGDYSGSWDTWNQEMQGYCEQDVEVTARLYEVIRKKVSQLPSDEFVHLEHDVASIIHRQEVRGFAFDRQAAVQLYTDLAKERVKLELELREVFKPWYRNTGEFTPKRPNKKMGYEAGAVCTKVRLVEFNPGSRDHISERLIALRGWTPQEFGNDGKPTVDDTILNQLPYPEAQLLARYLMIQKRIGQVAEGKEAWLRHEIDGVIHGQVMTNGAVTGRMTHMKPNIAQVPANDAPYGHECRSCFRARPGYILIGADADALELRNLAHFMARYDGGAYVETVLSGDKALGTDMHSVNARALKLDPKQMYHIDGRDISGRDIAKTWFLRNKEPYGGNPAVNKPCELRETPDRAILSQA